MMTGIDVLKRQGFGLLRGKRVGLLSHQAALTADGSTSAQLLRRALGKRLVALYGPEHGFFGQAGAGDRVATRRHPDWHIPVHSLYGRHRTPEPRMLKGVDVVVCDLQDLGVRCYTYLATLHEMLKVCAANSVEVVVADRPIPLPQTVDGPLTVPSFTSFVAPCALPMVYGMTPAESARWLCATSGLNLRLTTVPMTGWNRSEAAWDGQRPSFMPPSPGIRTWESAMSYAATVFCEALPGIDCGRGTNMAFRVLGAPWLRAENFCALPVIRHLKGVTLHPCNYVAAVGPYAGREINAVRLTVTDHTRFRPIETSAVLLRALADTYGQTRVWRHKGVRKEWFDKLYGTDRMRQWLLDGKPLSPLFHAWKQEGREFRQARKSALLYD
ncbi:MAG: DUF1343 domain-containing protein [Kiritimatiellae bacterium]|nr:DUF1343 domain-containing protein [Kiritimatiellia bacterium]